ncbi:MAG: hypothetical protein ABIR37_02705 [Candidatus Saccharimonadales bacterium]
MNKNLLKTMFISVGTLLLLAGSVFAQPVSAALDPGSPTFSGPYLEIPLNVTRERPTTKPSAGNCVGSIDDPSACIDIASGIGMYQYVGLNPSPTDANIGGTNIQILVVDGTDNTTNYTRSFSVTGGKLRVYGLTLTHKYRFNFSYVDSASPDIQKIINNMPKYCEGTTDSFSKLDKTSNEWAISRNLVDGCNRYDKEPFLPAVVGVTVPSTDTYATFNKSGQVLAAVNIKAAAPASSVSSTVNKSDDDGCAVAASDPMRVFACPLINWGKDATNKLDSIIQNFLFVPTDQLFTPAMEKAWNTFRILGVALILIAGLVMVISQAIGLELFDAYTVRKVLPRLLVAAIGMALSWPLMQFVVTFFNDIGVWSHDLILAPFGDAANKATGAIILAPLLTASAGGVYLAVSMGVAGTLSLLFAFVLACMLGLFVLAIRQLVIMVAVILAPLAIAAYILPGTQKLWTFWKDAFLTSLVMFPIIMAFIAIGKALAVVAAGSNSTEMHILSVIVYFAPYFLLPFAFKLAGGLMATVFSIANDRSRGLFDRGRKKRQELGQQRRTRAASNSLWDPKYRLGNTFASWAADPGSNAVYSLGKRGVPGFKRGSAKISGQIEHARVEQTGKLFEELNKMGYNDRAYRALAGLHGDMSDETRAALRAKGLYNKAPQSMSELQTMSDILGKSGSATEQIAANAIHGSMGRLSTLYQDPEMGKANIQAAGMLGLAAHGFATTRDLAQAGNGLQPIMGASAAQALVGQAQQLGARSHPETKNGYGVLYDSKKGEFVDGMVGNENIEARDVKMLTTLDSHTMAGAKGGAFDEIAPIITKVLKTGSAPGAQPIEAAQARAVQEQMFSWAGPYSQASVDIKAKTIEYLQKNSTKATRTRDVRGADGKTTTQSYQGWAEGSLMDQFERYARTEMSPEARGEGGPAPDPGAGGGGGGPA